jgi:hypothetical protein
MLDAVAKPVAALQAQLGVTPTPQGFQAFTPSPGGIEGFGSGTTNLGQNNYGGLAGAGMYGGGGAAVINYNINASGIGDQQIAAVVQGAIQDLNRYGNSTTYAGAI